MLKGKVRKRQAELLQLIAVSIIHRDNGMIILRDMDIPCLEPLPF
jgi:hypothetical protein